MKKFIFSGFTDEFSNIFDRQIQAAKDFGMDMIELRGADCIIRTAAAHRIVGKLLVFILFRQSECRFYFLVLFVKQKCLCVVIKYLVHF